MASFYGRQQTAANQGTTQPAAAVAGPAACLKSCEKVMNQCLVDATTFMEKERCRDRHDVCSGKCGAVEAPAVTRTTTAPQTAAGLTAGIPQGAAGAAGGAAGADPCKSACRTTKLRCIADGRLVTECNAEFNACVAGCGGEPEPEPEPGPRPGDCTGACAFDWRRCRRDNSKDPAAQRRCDETYARCKLACPGIGGTCKEGRACPGGDIDCGGIDKGKCVSGKCRCTGTNCVPGEACDNDARCKGGKCVNGKCDCNVRPECVEGKACADSTQCVGEACINGKCHCTGGGCKDDAYCIKKHGAGWYCYKTAGSDRGICKKKGDGGDCTPGKRCTGPEKNNPQCGGLKCFRPKFKGDESVAGTCYCNVGPGQEEKKGGGGTTTGTGTLGEYQWPTEMTDLYNQITGKAGDYLNVDLPDYKLPPELQTLLDSLIGRGSEYLARKPGYSQSALDAQFGKGYENIRNLGTAARGQTLSDLQREGMLGTGAGQAALRQIPWQTEKNISDVVRDVFLGNEEQKRKDREAYTNIASGLFGQGVGTEQMVEAINAERRGEERDYTGIANQLFGSGMTYNQLQEAINASRRGEGQNALALWMQYLMSLMSSWKS